LQISLLILLDPDAVSDDSNAPAWSSISANITWQHQCCFSLWMLWSSLVNMSLRLVGGVLVDTSNEHSPNKSRGGPGIN
jgi:hypothetical protein